MVCVSTNRSFKCHICVSSSLASFWLIRQWSMHQGLVSCWFAASAVAEQSNTWVAVSVAVPAHVPCLCKCWYCLLLPALWMYSFHEWMQPAEYDTGEGLANNTEQWYSSVVVAVTTIFFVLVECDDVGTAHVLGHSPFLPALLKEFMQVIEERINRASLDHFWRKAIISWSFDGSLRTDGLPELFYRGWNIKLFHDSQVGGGVFDCCVGNNILPWIELLVTFCPSLDLFTSVS